ncbi:hypothetical protein FF011L_44540 [Roseimaritima multifibrata]|uniref:Outer membrane efflux protein n=1 Tax=Roseimaritima multifibrata TaxID=1930274 RepID=A0A517ML88_9BACT|nr:hypothetical protein [Roseimaritima multifibrata]QDS95656.1 hypothetical protein FF011L_44540 [Roseimaritima multifibrata]
MFSSKSYLVLTILGLAAFLVSTTISAQTSTEESDSRIRDLLIEKRDVLERHLTYVESQFGMGELQSLDVLDAKLKLLDAELALADSAADRIKIFKDRLDVHRAMESQTMELYTLGNVTYGENIEAVVHRIDAAIDLSRATGDD